MSDRLNGKLVHGPARIREGYSLRGFQHGVMLAVTIAIIRQLSMDVNVERSGLSRQIHEMRGGRSRG
jgi:hypothetical protein